MSIRGRERELERKRDTEKESFRVKREKNESEFIVSNCV